MDQNGNPLITTFGIIHIPIYLPGEATCSLLLREIRFIDLTLIKTGKPFQWIIIQVVILFAYMLVIILSLLYFTIQITRLLSQVMMAIPGKKLHLILPISHFGQGLLN